eukprot:scaffold205222_cov26-Prasinocladus_malaysianus.AAC.1
MAFRAAMTTVSAGRNVVDCNRVSPDQGHRSALLFLSIVGGTGCFDHGRSPRFREIPSVNPLRSCSSTVCTGLQHSRCTVVTVLTQLATPDAKQQSYWASN